MIEIIDLIQIIAVEPTALNFPGVDVETKSLGVLRCKQVQLPERKQDRHRDCQCGEQEDEP